MSGIPALCVNIECGLCMQHGVLSSRPATPPSHSQAQAAPNPQHSNALRDRTSLNHRGSGSESISGRTSGFFPSNLSIPDGPHSQPGPSMDPPPSSNGHDLSPKPRRTHTSHDNADSTAGRGSWIGFWQMAPCHANAPHSSQYGSLHS